MASDWPNGVARTIVFKAYLASDHVSVATGKTIAITISKNGATSFSNPAAGATNATEMASGFYKFALGTGDTDTNGPLAWRGAVATVDDVGDVFDVVNATNGKTTALPAAAAAASGGLIINGSNTGAITLNGLTTGALAASSIAVSGTTTFTGAVTGTSGSNDLRINGAAAGASGGLLISGSNAGTTTLGALTVTGAVTATSASNDLRVNGAVPGAAGGLFIAGTNAATTITTALTTTFTGNLTGAVGSVTAGVNAVQLAGQTITAAAGVTFPASVASPTNITGGTITTVTNLTNAPTAGDLTATMKASVNAEVVDALNVDTYAEQAQGTPPATATLRAMLQWLYMAWRNKSTQSSSQYSLYADDTTTIVAKAAVSDDGSTLTSAEKATGP